MFNFSAIVDQAKLFHSSDIGELMGREEPFDLQEMITSLGISAEDLRGLAPDQALNLLQEKGLDPEMLQDSPVLEQIREIVGSSPEKR